ncbi:MAG: AMP-binding protein [archaeon]|nr:AMP-binding protein [archaeon]
MSPTVKQFARWFFPEHVRFAESYGATECGAITEDERAMAGVDIRLRSLTDVGLPAGYGEILVKTSTMSSGYLDPELTKAAFDDDGYFHTGDVGKYFRDEKDEREGERLQIVDRVGNVLFWKGEIILPTQLEASFQRSKFVRDVCISLLSSSQTLVLLVQIASSNTSMEDLKTDFLSLEPDLFACSSDGQSPVILISPCEWTVENKLLNIHFKKNRPVLQSFALSLINSSSNPK